MTGPTSAPGRLHRGLWRDPAVLLATGFGSGFLRPGPGTWGSLVGLGVWWWALAGLSWPAQVAAAAAVFLAGTGLAHRLARRYGVHDDPCIVVDEFVGQWLALLVVPVTPMGALLGFVAFRLFDVWKPWPVSWVERRVPGGLGVMADDALAGGLAAIVLQLAFWAVAWLVGAPAP